LLQNIDNGHLINAAGKEFLGGTTYVGITATLQNAVLSFEARGGPSWELCTIAGGNLVAVDDVGANIDPRLPTAYTSVDRTASASATLQEQSALQYASYSGGVTVDTGSSYSGVDYPVGTPQAPVNNLADALDIAADKGFTVFFILGDITIDSGLDFTQISFVGESIDKSEFTVDPDANVTQCEFYEATIQGALDGECKIKECKIVDVNYISGVVELCILSGDIELGGGAEAYFLDCWAGTHLGTPPSIDIGGSGQSLVMQNFNGYIRWKNLSGASDQANASLNAGWVVLENTITGGYVTIIGTGIVEDYSTGGVVNFENLVNPHNISNHVWADPRAQLLYDIEGGRWKLESDQMIFYEDDNLTEVARFNLFDSAGNPTMENVYERQRVVDDSWMYPVCVMVNKGSITSGDISVVQTADDNRLVLAEETGSPGFDYSFFFTRVNTISDLEIQLNGFYNGNPAHNVKGITFNWSTCGWTYLTVDSDDFPSGVVDVQYNFTIPAPRSSYVSSEGHLFFGVRHESNGSAGHTFNIDELKLVEV
jgi:hypothetical protein